MNRQQLAIATISWARDEDEEILLRQSLQQLSSLHIPVFITDGGSTPDFINYISKLNNFTICAVEEKGLWSQANASLHQAANSGAQFILYTEPDKLDFFKHLPKMIDELEVNEDTGVILASRSAEAIRSFPAFQQMTEATINNCCAQVIGHAADYTYGPFILKSKIVPLLQVLQKDIGWGWRPYAFNVASRLGLHIKIHIGHFYCPSVQQEDDDKERVYRIKQLAENINGLVLSVNAPLG